MVVYAVRADCRVCRHCSLGVSGSGALAHTELALPRSRACRVCVYRGFVLSGKIVGAARPHTRTTVYKTLLDRSFDVSFNRNP